MNGRLVVLQHPDSEQRAAWLRRLGPGWGRVSASGLDLLVQGCPLRESVDGRAVGARTGVLYNLVTRRAELAARGIATERLDGDGVCVEAVGARGPQALGQLARHGLLGVLHRSQGGVLVASDAQGLAPLYVLYPPEGGVVVAGDRVALRAISGADLARHDADWRTLLGPRTGTEGLWRAPSGQALLLSARGLQAHPWQTEGDAAPYLRHRPAALSAGDGDDVRALLDATLRDAVAAWRADRGPVVAPSVRLAGATMAPSEAAAARFLSEFGPRQERGTPWSCAGWTRLRAEFAGSPLGVARAAHTHNGAPPLDELISAYRAAHEGSPFRAGSLPEPESRLSARRRLARWLRYTLWRCGPLERLLDESAAHGRAIALPHLAPAVVAALGALADDAWPWADSAAPLLT